MSKYKTMSSEYKYKTIEDLEDSIATCGHFYVLCDERCDAAGKERHMNEIRKLVRELGRRYAKAR